MNIFIFKKSNTNLAYSRFEKLASWGNSKTWNKKFEDFPKNLYPAFAIPSISMKRKKRQIWAFRYENVAGSVWNPHIDESYRQNPILG